jgi:hypothetical protein
MKKIEVGKGRWWHSQRESEGGSKFIAPSSGFHRRGGQTTMLIHGDDGGAVHPG